MNPENGRHREPRDAAGTHRLHLLTWTGARRAAAPGCVDDIERVVVEYASEVVNEMFDE